MFSPEESREARFDAAVCNRHDTELSKELGVDGVCGLCPAVCPHGRKGGKK